MQPDEDEIGHHQWKAEPDANTKYKGKQGRCDIAGLDLFGEDAAGLAGVQILLWLN